MKKGFTLVELIGVVIILGMIALLAFPPLLNMLRDTNAEISKVNETLLLTAADQYINQYQNDFPKEDGNVYCITYGDLIKEELISSSIPNKDGQIIDYNTKIKVAINNGKYEYSVDNSCKVVGFVSLIESLKEQYQEGNTKGLVKDADGSYYYTGTKEEVSNNFIWFAGHLWRILNINSDDSITMITQQPLSAIQPSDEVWVTKEKYDSSYLNKWLNDLNTGVFLKGMDLNDRNKIQTSTFNIGQVDHETELTTTQKVGILDTIQYAKAGGTDSFLDIKNTVRLSNWYSDHNPANISEDGHLVSNYMMNNCYGIRPIIRVSDFQKIIGNGTLTDPYREKSMTTNTSNIKIGEYVEVPGSNTYCNRVGHNGKCLFRVVSKDNDSIKVILNGVLPTTSIFDQNGNSTYASGNTIDTILMDFVNTFDSRYRYLENKNFNIGQYSFKDNYTVVQNLTYTGNAGLPVVGEMFSGNDIEISNLSEKTFVNSETIENATAANAFWLMNTYDTSYTWAMRSFGEIYLSNITTAAYGVRPVLFLNNNLTFTGGEGTAENPFTLE